MKKYDKTVLLFETLIGISDPTVVNYKINEIQAKKEYKRVVSLMPSVAKTQLLEDVVKRFNSLEVVGIVSFKEAIFAEQEINDLDRRISNFTGVNPYLTNGTEKAYKVKALGEVGVEINARGVKLNEFTTDKGVSRLNRRKVMLMKAFNWYREAKITLKHIQEELRCLVKRVRLSKLSFKSLNFENFVSGVLMFSLTASFFFAPFGPFQKWREVAFDGFWNKVLLLVYGVFAGAYFLFRVAYTRYKTYPFHLTSQVRKQIVKQYTMIEDLEDNSIKLEHHLAKLSKKSRKIRTNLEDISILNKYSRKSNAEVLDYIYCENDYFYQNHRHLIRFIHLTFLGVTLCCTAIICLLLVL